MRARIVAATLLAGLVALLLAVPAALAAPPVVAIRTGDHPGYGRVVFDLPAGTVASSQEANGRLVVRFEPAATIGAAGPLPRNVRAIAPVDGGAEVGVAPGAQLRIMRIDGKFVVDVLDAATAAAAPKPAPPAVTASPPAASAPAKAAAAAVAALPPAASTPAKPVAAAVAASPPAASTPAKPAAAAVTASPPAASTPPKPAPPAVTASPPAAAAPTKPAAPMAVAARAPVGGITLPLDRHDDTAPPAAIATAPTVPAAPAPVADAHLQSLESLVLVPEPVPSPADPSPPVEIGNIVSGAVLSLAVTPQTSPAGGASHAAALPFDPGVGAAAFRRGRSAVIVFDERRPLDMSALHNDPFFAAADIHLLPTATILRLPMPEGNELRLTRTDRGWTVTAMARGAGAVPALRPIRPEPGGGLVGLRTDDAGQVVSVPDPDTGGMLLVGTQRQSGQSVAVARTAPDYALLPTWQGVAVEPVSDRLTLRVASPGFVLHLGVTGQISLAAESNAAVLVADAHNFSRRYDFPALPPQGLRWRLQAATAAAAATPARERGPARLAVAQAMVALGMGIEAQSVIGAAVGDDGRLADNPDLVGLKAMASLLAGRTADGDFSDARLAGSDEIALWRAVLVASQEEGSPQAAPVFAAELPLLLSYPETLRDRLLPLAVETMALGGEQAAARQLLDDRKDDHALDLARALLLQQAPNPRPALELFDKLASAPDRLVRSRAAVRAVELRLASGALTPAQAADALDKLLYSWRGDTRELALRLRVAELRRQTGAWRPALALLRETAEIWPDQKPLVQARMADIFAEALLRDAATPLPPLELVALAEENADLLPIGEAGQDLAARLADRLVALDLPRRAVPVLEKLAESAPAGPVRAAFGDRLASMRLAQADPMGALAALAASDAPSLPEQLLQARTLTFARAAAAKGELPRATAALAALATVAADALRAELLEAAKDWPAAEAALRDYAARTVPDSGPLDEPAARTLLRRAAAAADSGDELTLARLREHDTARLPGGKIAEMFRLITAGPVQGAADLPRASQESKLAGALPVALKALAP